MGFREIKQKSRRDLHNQMKVPAFLYPQGSNPNGFEPETIYVRVHNKNANQGDQAGTSLGYAEVREDVPKAVFDLLEVDPERHDVIMISVAEGYRINTLDPPDGEFQAAAINRLTATELAGFSAP